MHTKNGNRTQRVRGGSQREVLRDVMMSATEGLSSTSRFARAAMGARHRGGTVRLGVPPARSLASADATRLVQRAVVARTGTSSRSFARMLNSDTPSEEGGFNNRTRTPSHGPIGSEGERRRVDERQAGAGIRCVLGPLQKR